MTTKAKTKGHRTMSDEFTCARCKGIFAGQSHRYNVNGGKHCHSCFYEIRAEEELAASLSDQRAKEEREAWVAFAAGVRFTVTEWPVDEELMRACCGMKAKAADWCLRLYRKRFPTGGAE